ncbi:hypothetical protein RJ639_040242 [Escallonia herrerae]|uniref:non-specific serine/threonine protein kinase n=1 Tax=Escallonia herrerae TaxID=1293975 RepID=A0AA88WU74_9ASTE|nr:hypothetical protein RJ639_040242 [Escallonia herrerae]
MKPRSHSLALFLCSLFLVAASAASTNGLYKDTQQLLSFKALVKNPDSLQNWVSGSSPCSFTGVTCNNSRVSGIDLHGAILNLDFVAVATNLLTIPYLETLSLKSSNLTGTVTPAARSSCSPVLSYLDLSGNGISGPVSDLDSFAACRSLKSLNLSLNSMDFTINDSKGLKLSLETLDLSYNRIVGSNVVPWLLSNGCEGLRHLSLKGNKAGGAVGPLMDCKSLKHLDLSTNNFSSGFPSFGDCSYLQYLDLSSNKFRGDVTVALSTCKQLSLLNLTHNLFSGAIPVLPSGGIHFLYLSGNLFQGVMPPHLADLCTSLVELDLSSNNLSGSVPASFGACSSLEFLDISNNNFSGELPIDTLFQLSSLKTLVLAFNNFVGGLPESLSKLSNLETFDVSSNDISGLIPWGLCQSPGSSLRFLYLQNNVLTGPIPDTLGNCSELVTLDLSFNFLNGIIPKSLGSLSKLRDLILWLNELGGEIPQELMYIQTLENLILDFNDLTGSIPASLSNCTNLNWISLSNNLLTGEIPASIGGLNNLAILKLGNNSLSGSIPAELGDCRSLIWLDLNTNFLNGSIPPGLFKQSGNIAVALLTGKTYVYIKNDGSKQCHGAGNLLEFGGIRQERLDRISTRHPCNFTRVYRGITQPTFNHNGSMIFLDMSYNSLEGSIPKELGSMYYLQILNLGHNDLAGPIPQELGGLKNVAILDLSYNKFNGSIPQSLNSLTLLSEVDLSNNNLSGMIPESAPLDTFPDYRFLNNSGLCGYPLPRCGQDPNASSNGQHQRSHRRQASLAGSVAMGLLFSLFCVFGLIIIAVETRKRRKKKEAALEAYMDGNSHSGPANSAWKLTSAREALSINLSTFEKPLRKLTFADLLQATNGFHDNSLIGSGGFGDVYRAQLKDGSVVAIKKLIHSFRCSTKGDVYSYGVVLLELLTGRQPTDSADFGDNNLVGWVKQHAKLKISDIFDPELLKEDASLEIELLQHLKVACACLDDRPWLRPTMIQVMAMFKEIQAGSGNDSSSTIAGDDGSFSAVEGVEMSIKEDAELGKQC